MKRLLVILAFMIVAINHCYSQGFDWQYSVRFPSPSPQLFIGINYNYQLSLNNINIDFKENGIPSGTFNEAHSSSNKYGISSEYWLNSGTQALTFSLNYHSMNANLRAVPDPIYYKNDTIYTEITNKNALTYLDLSAYYKHRFPQSHFSISAGIIANIFLDNSSSYTENITSENRTFNNGERSREILNACTSDYFAIIINPSLRLSYDFPIANNVYATVFADYSMNINSLLRNHVWKNNNFSLGISIFKSIY